MDFFVHPVVEEALAGLGLTPRLMEERMRPDAGRGWLFCHVRPDPLASLLWVVRNRANYGCFHDFSPHETTLEVVNGSWMLDQEVREAGAQDNDGPLRLYVPVTITPYDSHWPAMARAQPERWPGGAADVGRERRSLQADAEVSYVCPAPHRDAVEERARRLGLEGDKARGYNGVIAFAEEAMGIGRVPCRA